MEAPEINNPLNSPLFSVVIPAYNRAKIISRAIDSVLAQTFIDYEIIVIDDGSNDDLESICKKYNDEKLHYYYQNNAGACAARNFGIKKSSGYYVAFLDSDDTWEPEYLHEVNDKFSSDTNYGCVWVRSIQKQLPDEIVSYMDGKPLEGNVYKEILEQGYLTSTSFITAKRSLLDDIDGFDLNLPASQDDDICFRLAKVAKIGCVNKTLGTLYIDNKIERISTSDSRRAYGWFLLWCKFADDVILYCNKKEFTKKLINVYFMFKSANDISALRKVEKIIIEKTGFLNYKINFLSIFFNSNFLKIRRKIKKILLIIIRKY